MDQMKHMQDMARRNAKTINQQMRTIEELTSEVRTLEARNADLASSLKDAREAATSFQDTAMKYKGKYIELREVIQEYLDKVDTLKGT